MKHAITKVIGVVLMLGSSVSYAQNAPAQAPAGTGPTASQSTTTGGEAQGQNGGTLQEITVTGTLIPTAESETALPVTTYDRNTLQNWGGTQVIDALRTIPSFMGPVSSSAQFNGTNSGIPAAGLGAATVDLRGIGDKYTVSLVNGIRVDALRDANLIPQNFISAIDVLKDGESTRYGSDAVGGVVNFKLRKAFPQGEYAEFDISYKNTTESDGAELNVTALGSYRDDRISLVGGYDYYHRNSILLRDRFVTANSDTRNLGGEDTRSYNFAGDVFDPNGDQFVPANQYGQPTSQGDYTLASTAASGNTRTRNDAFGFNFFGVDPALPSYERHSAYAALDVKVVPQLLNFTGTFLYTHSVFYDFLAATPIPGDLLADAAQTSPYAPLYGDISAPGSQPAYRTFELGYRQQYRTNDVYLFQGGFNGEIPSFAAKWISPIDWEINYQSEENGGEEYHNGDVLNSVVAQEITSGLFNPYVSRFGPRSGTLVVNGVPHSFNNDVALSRASYNETERFPNTFRIIDVDLHFTLLPDLVQGGLTVAGGYEYRWEQQANLYGIYTRSPGPFGIAYNVPGFSGVSYNEAARSETGAIFGEALLPIFTPEMKIPGLYSLDVDGAIRYEATSNSGLDTISNGTSFVISHFHQTTPKVTVRYQPTEDITLRGSYSEGYRTPNLNDEFQAPQQNFLELFNPRTGKSEQPTQGVLIEGSPNLKPERARIYTAGIIWSPRFVPGTLTVSADYYGIYQKDLVLSGNPQPIVDAFFSSGAFANQIGFNPDGSYKFIDATALNVASRDVEGIDLNLLYQTPKANWGQVTFTTEWNYVFKYKVQYGQGQEPTNYLGRYSDPSNGDLSPGSIPYWKGFVDLNYTLGGFGIGGKINYVGAYRDDSSVIQVSPPTRNVREYTTLDLRASYEFARPEEVQPPNQGFSKDGKGGKQVVTGPTQVAKPSIWARLLGGLRVQVGINNVFGTEPPFSAGAAGGANVTYDTSLYNIQDRVYYVNVTKTF